MCRSKKILIWRTEKKKVSILKGIKRRAKRLKRRLTSQKSRVKKHFKKKSGRNVNLKHPERFSDKLAWLKLYYRDELMRTCTDKASVREYVEKCGLGEYLNEQYAVYDSVKDIDWDALPDQFVMKDTLAGYSDGVLLVYDKSTLNIKQTELMLEKWLKRSSYRTTGGGLWIHEGRKARIIAEKLLIHDADGDLPDYKFFCFGGKVFCLYLMRNYTQNHNDGENAFLDRDFKLLPVSRSDYRRITVQPEKPKNFEKMIEIAEKLSKPFPHVRVDLYNIDGAIYFGELTFFTNGGYIPFVPDSFDYEMGKQLVLPKRNH